MQLAAGWTLQYPLLLLKLFPETGGLGSGQNQIHVILFLPFFSWAPNGFRTSRRQAGRDLMTQQHLQCWEEEDLGFPPPPSGKARERIRIPGSWQSPTSNTQSCNYVAEPRGLLAAQGHPTVSGNFRTGTSFPPAVSVSSRYRSGRGSLVLEEGMGLPQEFPISLVEDSGTANDMGFGTTHAWVQTPWACYVILGRFLLLSDTRFSDG